MTWHFDVGCSVSVKATAKWPKERAGVFRKAVEIYGRGPETVALIPDELPGRERRRAGVFR